MGSLSQVSKAYSSGGGHLVFVFLCQAAASVASIQGILRFLLMSDEMRM